MTGFWTPERRHSLYLGILLFILSAIVQITLGHYSSMRSLSAPYARDVFLDNLPVVDLTPVIVAGNILLWIFGFFLLIKNPRYLSFGIKAIALLDICRAFFISLTHLGPYPHAFSPGPDNFGYGIYKIFTFQGNYFFSGHTALPFMFALIFWDNDLLRRFFVFLTAFFGAAVLFAHVHYSIDVFAAPFIVYGVYAITTKVFAHDYALAESG